MYKLKKDAKNILMTKAPYKISAIFRDGKTLKITISQVIEGIKYKFSIRDSYDILPSSVAALGEVYDVNTQKGLFPYKFYKRVNLFYIGNTPDITYYKNITPSDYKNLVSDKWCFYDETIKYFDDLVCLYEVLQKVNQQIFLSYDINMSSFLTISGLARKIFRTKYYKKNIPNTNLVFTMTLEKPILEV